MGIDNAPRLDASGVREGRAVSGVNSYSIYLEAVSEDLSEATSETLKIWNVPGMSVKSANPAVEITDAAGFSGIPVSGLAGKTYVLANDITLAAGWTPAGTDAANAFQGKFYGAGRTITVSGNPAASGSYTGLFGYTEGAEIRDLQVYYAVNVNAGASATRIGGLAGYAGGGTKIRNVLVTGAGNAALIYTSGAGPYIGGIAGHLEGGGSRMENAYASLNLKVSTSAGIFAGGMVGYLSAASLKDCLWAGNLECSSSTTSGLSRLGGIAGSFRSAADLNPAPELRNAVARGNITAAGGAICAGGLTGEAYSSTGQTRQIIADSYYENGYIRVDANSTIFSYAGGLFGRFPNDNTGPEVTGCWSRAGGIAASQAGDGGIALGGFCGVAYPTEIEGCYSESPLTLIEAPLTSNIFVGGFIGYMEIKMEGRITSCYAKADLNVIGRRHYTGGLFGYAIGDGNFVLRNSYAAGNVSSAATTESYTGGLIGRLGCANALISGCWTSGSVHARGSPGKTNVLYAGGLVGHMTDSHNIKNITIENSYALGDVAADDPYSGGDVCAGGLVGYMDSSAGVYHSFARGSVTAQTASGSGVYAGGIVGYRDAGAIEHCVARGETITAKGTNTNRTAARIFAYPDIAFSDTNGSSSDNYALNVMYLEAWDAYRYGTIPSVTRTPDAAGPHGANVWPGTTGSMNLGTANFWETTMGFNTAIWNMIGVARGYPTLAGMGGQ
jgi:hypothetical protein